MTDITFIVCTRNRKGSLERCLASIERAATARPDIETEVVVVDNGSSDGTGDFLCEWAGQTSVPLKSIYIEEPGVSRAKNEGIREASGNILVFTDDDCCVAGDFVSKLVLAYSEDNRPVLRGGRVELGDPQDLPFTIKTDIVSQEYREPTHPGGFAHGCNLTISRSVVDLVGGFDVRFGPGVRIGAAEDTEYVYRAYLAGVKVLYDPDIVVYHFHGRRHLDDIRKLHNQYNVGNGALYAKYAFASPILLRHLYWDFRNGFFEYFGGPLFNDELRLRHHGKILGNIRGAVQYWLGKSDGRNVGREQEAQSSEKDAPIPLGRARLPLRKTKSMK